MRLSYSIASACVRLVPIALLIGCATPMPTAPSGLSAKLLQTLDTQRVRYHAHGVGKTYESAILDGQMTVVAVAARSIAEHPEERARLEARRSDMYARLRRYVAESKVVKRVANASGDVEVDLIVDLHRTVLEEDLVAWGIATSRQELLEALAFPTVAVLPDATAIQADWRQFAESESASYLTQRRYDVIELDALRKVEQSVQQIRVLAGLDIDPTAMIALQAGADVYFTYSVRVEHSRSGSTPMIRAIAAVKAFETTTARGIGTGSGFSKEYVQRPGVMDKAIAEALADAFGKTLGDVEAYWREDMRRGSAYIVTFSGDFSSDNRAARRAVHDVLSQIARTVNQDQATASTLNYRLRYDGSNTDLLYALQDGIEARVPGVRVHETTMNRKLLVLAIE